MAHQALANLEELPATHQKIFPPSCAKKPGEGGQHFSFPLQPRFAYPHPRQPPMSTRAQNEKKFGAWDELPGGGRRYRLDVADRLGWRARYLKEVDNAEATLRFYQEVYDDQAKLVEVHERFPVDKGHQKV